MTTTNKTSLPSPFDLLPSEPIDQPPGMCSAERFLQEFPDREPAYSECGKIGKRALSWATWIDGFSSGGKGSFIDRHNLEFAHEHIFFEGSKENIGNSPHGLFVENRADWDYRMDDECLDGSVLRKAIAAVKTPPSYNFIRDNCQDFVERVRKEYRKLLSSRKDEVNR